MAESIVIREATPADGPALARIHRGARAAAMPWLAVVHNDADTEKWMAASVIPRQRVRVATVDGAVVGFSAYNGGWLNHLYVSPGFQNRGIGTLLFKDVWDAAPKSVRCWVFQRNTAARRFYERQGCAVLRTTEGKDNKEKEPDVLYEKVFTDGQ